MKKFLLRTTGILVILLALILVLLLSVNYSTGYRAGTIIKMSKKGLMIKTYEGQLNTGGFSESTGGADITSSIWNFSIKRNRKDVLTEIEKAVDQGSRVKLFYKEKLVRLFWVGETRYFIDKVEPVDSPGKNPEEKNALAGCRILSYFKKKEF